jgi:hypothetical protein
LALDTDSEKHLSVEDPSAAQQTHNNADVSVAGVPTSDLTQAVPKDFPNLGSTREYDGVSSQECRRKQQTYVDWWPANVFLVQSSGTDLQSSFANVLQKNTAQLRRPAKCLFH